MQTPARPSSYCTVPVLTPFSSPTRPRPSPLFKSKVFGPEFSAKGRGSISFSHLPTCTWNTCPTPGNPILGSVTDHTHLTKHRLWSPRNPSQASPAPGDLSFLQLTAAYCLPQSRRNESLCCLGHRPPVFFSSSIVHLFLCSLPLQANAKHPEGRDRLPTLIPHPCSFTKLGTL